MANDDAVPIADAQRQLIEDSSVRRKAARANWSLHVLFAFVPFGMFWWGGRHNITWMAIAGWVLFAVTGVHGYLAMRKTRRCPACDSFVVPRMQIPYLMCETCGVRLSTGTKDEI